MSTQKYKKKKRVLLKGQDKYDKITYREKMFLLKIVFIDNIQIKETAKHLDINYSTAKTFLRKFKTKNTSMNLRFIANLCNWFSKHQKSNERCTHKVVNPQFTSTKESESHMEFFKMQQKSGEYIYRSGDDEYLDSSRHQQVEIVQHVLFKD